MSTMISSPMARVTCHEILSNVSEPGVLFQLHMEEW